MAVAVDFDPATVEAFDAIRYLGWEPTIAGSGPNTTDSKPTGYEAKRGHLTFFAVSPEKLLEQVRGSR